MIRIAVSYYDGDFSRHAMKAFSGEIRNLVSEAASTEDTVFPADNMTLLWRGFAPADLAPYPIRVVIEFDSRPRKPNFTPATVARLKANLLSCPEMPDFANYPHDGPLIEVRDTAAGFRIAV